MDDVYSFGDFTRIFDGNNSTENHFLAEISGNYNGHMLFPSNIISSNNQLFIEHVTDEWWREHGFRLKIYTQSKHGNLSAHDCSMIKPCLANQGHCQSDDECKGYLKCGHNNCPAEIGYHPKARCCYDFCAKWLDMENGILTSPWYPGTYPSNLRCRTLITVGMTVAGPRTITLEFLHFKVNP